ncbi:MAG: SirB2 family protein [Hafnia alvei]|jgi:uncharacterized membrane protein SirB2|uniref:SirB2 family protein n=1 Tax=Hafnia alvei TaxID=569 RepID=UPI00290DE816|nr:SirB2 family protein [Hafnia alvei]MDU7480544.1 SirB2 family protein [Hafnia alvei]
MEAYIGIKHLHLLTVAISVVLFILRFFWKCRNSAMIERRWVKIAPHLNDTLLFVTGIALVFITRFYPFTPQGTWLTEKLVGVIIYVVLGYVALGKRPRSQKVRCFAFVAALVCLYLIIKLAMTKMPLLMGYV